MRDCDIDRDGRKQIEGGYLFETEWLFLSGSRLTWRLRPTSDDVMIANLLEQAWRDVVCLVCVVYIDVFSGRSEGSEIDVGDGSLGRSTACAVLFGDGFGRLLQF